MFMKQVEVDFLEKIKSTDLSGASLIADNLYKNTNDFKKIENLIINALDVIGKGWEDGNISLAQVYMSGIICEKIINKYIPVFNIETKEVPKIGVCVLLDHHSLGKKIVESVIKANGYSSIDLGVGLTPEDIVAKVSEEKIDVLIISTLMLSSALKVKQVKEDLKQKGLKVKVIAGGAPFRLDSNLWKKVDADADGLTASEIVKVIQRVVTL